MSYVTFQGNSEIWSHKTGGHLIQVYINVVDTLIDPTVTVTLYSFTAVLLLPKK